METITTTIDYFTVEDVQNRIQRGDINDLTQKCCIKGKIDSVRLLLDYGIDPNKADSKGYTALSRSVQYGRIEIARLLLERGASVNLATNKGQTPLHLACQYGHEEMIIFLHQNGADPNLNNSEGMTPRQLIRIPRLREIFDVRCFDVKEPEYD